MSRRRYVVEKQTEYLWRILDTFTYTWEYVLFSFDRRPQCARMWVTDEIVDQPGIRGEIEERLADEMFRRGMNPPRVVGRLPKATMA
jgi:hypothetical protein